MMMTKAILLVTLLLTTVIINDVVSGMTRMGTLHRMKTGFGKRDAEINRLVVNLVGKINKKSQWMSFFLVWFQAT